MRRNVLWPFLAGTLIIIVAVICMSTPSLAGLMLKMVFIEVDTPMAVKQLARLGIDIAAVRKIPDPQDPSAPPRYRVDAVISKKDEKKLMRQGFTWRPAAEKKS